MRLIYTLLLVILTIGCADTGCTYEDFIQIERQPNNLIIYKDCTREHCPGLPDRVTCRLR